MYLHCVGVSVGITLLLPAFMSLGRGCQALGRGCQALGRGCQALGTGCQYLGMGCLSSPWAVDKFCIYYFNHYIS
jgi:hypothetical protein